MPRFALGIILLCFAFFALAPSVVHAQAADQATSAQAATQGDSNQASSVPDETLNARIANQSWMRAIDGFFKNWLVSPLEKVLMFDISFGAFLDPNDQAEGKRPAKIPFVVAWLFAAGVYLTIRMGFINFRAFRHAILLTTGRYDKQSDPGEVSHFQALSSALSATVGLGNIGGVAIAIGLGGPGATFWMIVIGLLGMTSKFTECTLGLMYRSVDSNGRVLGGPMRYLKEGFEAKQIPIVGTVLSTVFAVLCIGASFGGGNAYQVGQSLGVSQEVEAFSFLREHPYVYGIAMAIAVGLVVVGGIRVIGSVAGKIVPIMCLLYASAALYIVFSNIDQLPLAVSRILVEAFQPKSMFVGSVVGVMVYGIQRASFSNEAGVGSAAIAHSAAKTKEPVSEGIVALLEPFIDTVVVCSLTAITIVITGVFETKEGLALIADSNGAALTRLAFIEGGKPWFAYILYASVIMFAYSTCISWFYYGERSFVSLFGETKSMLFKVLFLTFTILGSIVSRGNILEFSDYMLLAMSIPNLIGVYFLSGQVRQELDRYWTRYQSGSMEPGYVEET